MSDETQTLRIYVNEEVVAVGSFPSGGGIVLETTASGDFLRVEVRPEVSDG